MKFLNLFLKLEYFALASISNNELRNLLSIGINVSNILILARIFNTITSMVIISTLLAREEATTKRKKERTLHFSFNASNMPQTPSETPLSFPKYSPFRIAALGKSSPGPE